MLNSSLLKNKKLYSSEGHYIIPCNEACYKQTFDWNVLLAWKDSEKSRVAFLDTNADVSIFQISKKNKSKFFENR